MEGVPTKLLGRATLNEPFGVLGSDFQRQLKLLCPLNIQSFYFISVTR